MKRTATRGDRLGVGLAMLTLGLDCAAPRRYGDSVVLASAQRTSIAGEISETCLWGKRPVTDAVVELYRAQDAEPMARASTDHNGRFSLLSPYVSDPDQRGRLRIASADWHATKTLPGFLDENYRVEVTRPCRDGPYPNASIFEPIVIERLVAAPPERLCTADEVSGEVEGGPCSRQLR